MWNFISVRLERTKVSFLQDSFGRVCRFQFVTFEVILNVGAHCRLYKALYKIYRSFFCFQSKFDSSIDYVFAVHDEEVPTWELMHEAFKQNRVELWYAPDVVFHDQKYLGNEKSQRKISMTTGKRISRGIIYSRSVDERWTMSFYPDPRPLMEKT